MISLIVDNKMRAFPRFTHYTCVAGEVEDTSVHGKFYAMDGDVRARGGFNLVEIEPSHFNQVRDSLVAPTEAEIRSHVTLNPGTAGLMGPFQAGDANTTSVKGRYVCAVPMPYQEALLRHPNGMSIDKWWKEIYPMIESKNHQAMCAGWIVQARMAMVKQSAGSNSLVNVAMPSPVCRHDDLHDMIDQGNIRLLPGLLQSPTGGEGVSAIHQDLQALMKLESDHRRIERAERGEKEKKEKAKKTIKGLVGDATWQLGCRLLEATDEKQWPTIYADLLQVKEAKQLGVLRAAV